MPPFIAYADAVDFSRNVYNEKNHVSAHKSASTKLQKSESVKKIIKIVCYFAQ